MSMALYSRTFKEAGTEKRSRAFSEISELFSRYTNNSNDCNQNKYCNINIDQPGKVTSISESLFMSSQIPISTMYLLFFSSIL